jgi:DNA polymerase I-like protein with 3'-5' exonuclease and polymerase domains
VKQNNFSCHDPRATAKAAEVSWVVLRSLFFDVIGVGDNFEAGRGVSEAVVNYACEHAEVTLQLAAILQQELAHRLIEHQYRTGTLQMAKTLGDWECDGIPVDFERLCSIRDSLSDQVNRLDHRACGPSLVFLVLS